ncbi:MAG TPA: molybdenum cofactor guanylyltransferase [Kofleriaceae bacterium]|nr:molybdenum cofactor guanylyltransferase [Kofleriaceae bacterium]
MSRPCSSDVSALILAGGRATRFGGVAKHELVIGGQTILARQTAVLAPRVAEIVIAAPRDIAGHRTVRDPIDGAGPLAGIAAGLAAVTTPWLVVVACDMPYLTGELIDRLLAARGETIDAVGVRVGGLPEPLVCVLHARARAAIDRRLAAGRYKASGLYTDENLAVHWIDDPDPRALRNINAPDDVRE